MAENMERRLDTLERNQSDLAKTITGIITAQNDLRIQMDDARIDKAVREERNRNLNERLDRIETSIENVYGLGKWLLFAVAAGFITATVTFVVKGGLSGFGE